MSAPIPLCVVKPICYSPFPHGSRLNKQMLKHQYPHMNNGLAVRIEEAVNLGSVKLHVFSPSKMEIWTVVGKDDEHWADLELQFCSCKHYYYKTMSNDGICYHIKSIEQAKQRNKFVRTDFNDAEYNAFLKVVLLDNTANLLSRCTV